MKQIMAAQGTTTGPGGGGGGGERLKLDLEFREGYMDLIYFLRQDLKKWKGINRPFTLTHQLNAKKFPKQKISMASIETEDICL